MVTDKQAKKIEKRDIFMVKKNFAYKNKKK